MTVGNGNEDSGWHYDWRFFNGKLRDGARTAIILERLLRNWFRFTESMVLLVGLLTARY